MLYAINKDNEKVLSNPDSEATCPSCNQIVIPKCGEIKVWHWAHKSLKECNYGEGETRWHLDWKSLVKKEFCEVRIGDHIADIFNGVFVIELQNQSLDTIKISEREKFYKKMIWLFNAEEFEHNFELRKKIDSKGCENDFAYRTFRWKYPRTTLGFCKKQIFLDFSTFIFQIKSLDTNPPSGGWGYKMSKLNFIKSYLKSVLKNEEQLPVPQ